MLKQLRAAMVILAILTLMTGVAYPLFITAAGQFAFPRQANGSLVILDGAAAGSELIGQATQDLRYFWSRPSAINTMLSSSLAEPGTSGATNYGPTSLALAHLVAARAEDFRKANLLPDDVAVPPEMLFASGSGLDPHIGPEAARMQVSRVAFARGLPRDEVAMLVEEHIEYPQFGLLGMKRINVLLLNLALDGLQ